MLEKRYSVKLDLSELNSAKITKTDTGRILNLIKSNHQSFIKIPENLNCKVTSTNILFYLTNKRYLSSFGGFKTLLTNALHSQTLITKKLFLHGLGYKVQISKGNFYFKIGFSHLVRLKRPKEIIRLGRIKKRPRLTIESYDKIKIGNFLNQVYNFKKLNSYKQKGFRFAGSKKKLKTFKKK